MIILCTLSNDLVVYKHCVYVLEWHACWAHVHLASTTLHCIVLQDCKIMLYLHCIVLQDDVYSHCGVFQVSCISKKCCMLSHVYIWPIDHSNIQGEWTPLMSAAFNGHVDVVCALMEAGVDIHAQDKV